MAQHSIDSGDPALAAALGLAHGPLASAEAEALRLTGIDLPGLEALMVCAGAENAAELRRRFLSDLAAAEAGLGAATTAAAAEGHAHVLLALAGQAGAARLQGLADRLLAAARLRDGGAVLRQVPAVLTGTAALARIIAGLRLPAGDRST